MASRKVLHFNATIKHRAGEGARVLGALGKAGVNMIAICGYPWGKAACLDLIPEDPARFRKAAKKIRLSVGKPDTAFFVGGKDKPGTVAASLAKLARARINVGCVLAVNPGGGRYGSVIFVRKADVSKAARALGL